MPVVVGVSDLTTAKTTRRAQHAQHAGADAVMILPVSYWKLSERETFQHFLSIGDAIGIPIIMYNNPATSGVDMSPELLVRILTPSTTSLWSKSPPMTFPGCSASTSSAAALPFYNGSNPLVLDALRAGAVGRCTAAPCLRSQPCIDLYDAVRAGELPRAQTIYTELKPLLEFIVAGGLATTVKAGLELIGAAVGDPRRPLLPLDDEGRAALQKLLTDV